MEKEYYLISFESTHYAMMLEKILKAKYEVDLIPTPREITASCGLSLKIKMSIFEDVKKTLKEVKIDSRMVALYKVDRREAIAIVEQIY